MGAEDYGMRVWDASGNLKLDVTDRVSRLAYLNIVPEEASQNSGALSQLSGHDTIQLSLTEGGTEHKVTRSSNTISWVSRSAFSDDDATILVFMY